MLSVQVAYSGHVNPCSGDIAPPSGQLFRIRFNCTGYYGIMAIKEYLFPKNYPFGEEILTGTFPERHVWV